MVPVKQIMEEAVTRKFVHEDSSHIVSLCGKSLPQSRAGRLTDLGRQAGEVGREPTDAPHKVLEDALMSADGRALAGGGNSTTVRTQSLQSQDSLRRLTRLPSLAPHSVKNLWIRTALFEKVLDRIVVYLVENS
ncbi:hypothetical protein CRUP_034539, partial [Coryphaenoides rupestris]